MAKLFCDQQDTYRDRLFAQRLSTECRLKSLRDVCLEYIGKNLHCITRASQYLATVHKELIIERLAFHDGFTESYLPHVTYNLFSPKLVRIYLIKCSQIDETWLRQLAASKCKLRYLTINDCENVTDAALHHITIGQNCLKELELKKLKITKKGLVHIKSSYLEKVDLRGCTLLDDKAVQMLVSSNPTIKYMNLVSCVKITDAVFPIIAQNLKANLEYLDVAELHCLSDVSIMALAKHCPNLKSLNILGCGKVTPEAMIQLFKGCSTMQFLDLSYCAELVRNPQSTKLVFANLPTTLVELSLKGLQITDALILVSGLGNLKRLSKLSLCGVPAVNDHSFKQIMQTVGAQLTFLDVSGSVMCSITDDGMSSVATYCTKLETLGIGLLKEVTGLTLLPLFEHQTTAQKLERLLMSLRKLDVLVLQAVVDNCCNLKQIDLCGTVVVTDEILRQLSANCNQISEINIKACRNVTDEGVIALAINCPLCVAVLSGLQHISDKSILALANNCPYLEELYLSGCDKVSKAAINYLQDMCIPRVHVSHRVPNSYNTARNLDTGNYEVQP